MYTVPKDINRESAVTVALIQSDDSIQRVMEELEELRLLADTAGAEVVDSIVQRRKEVDPATYIGSGKVKEIVNQAVELSCTLIIFNDEITPTQLKNIRKIAGEDIKVLDRTGLILDIFAQHARTKEAKTQVELAHMQYLLPRLTRMWTHLERQMGGVGTRGGPGETQIEIDRRLIMKRITQLKSELEKIDKQRQTQLQNRKEEFRVALVGYTNAGKSTLMKSLTGADVYIRDQLFATLDTTTRKMEFPKGTKILISDTVGFIHKLPHDLVASFKSTLKEAAEANLLLKLVDASSGQVAHHIQTIEEVLMSIQLDKIESILIFNKIDQVTDQTVMKQLKIEYPQAIFISALRQLKLNELVDVIQNIIEKDFITHTFKIRYSETGILDNIYSSMIVLSRNDDDDAIDLKVRGKKSDMKSVKDKLKEMRTGLSETLGI
ncbi:MAG: GTPase HflX [Candidatus Marinimicrobia bacterium]|nr:GTPase HflX [Candidatus Neomarinimicrobiota bacterium]